MIKKTLLDKNVNKIQHVFMTDGSSQVLEMSNEKMATHFVEIQHVFMTDGSSQVLEMSNEKMATHFVEVMNNNTDSGCIYEVITVKNNKK